MGHKLKSLSERAGGGGGEGRVGGGQRDDEEEGEDGLLSTMDAPISQSALGSSNKGWMAPPGNKKEVCSHALVCSVSVNIFTHTQPHV